MKKPTRTAALAALVAAFAAPIALDQPAALASSMPKADFGRANTFGVGLGNGVSLALDFPVASQVSLGGAVGLPGFAAGNLDIRLLYKLLAGTRRQPSLALLVGAQASGPRFGQFSSFGPMAGVALAYGFTPQLTGRLNLVAGFSGGFDARPSGAEIAYRFTPSLEGTLGFNGRGDVIGLKVGF